VRKVINNSITTLSGDTNGGKVLDYNSIQVLQVVKSVEMAMNVWLKTASVLQVVESVEMATNVQLLFGLR